MYWQFLELEKRRINLLLSLVEMAKSEIPTKNPLLYHYQKISLEASSLMAIPMVEVMRESMLDFIKGKWPSHNKATA